MNGFLKSGYLDPGSGTVLYVKATPCENSAPLGSVVIAHGLAETAEYYDEFARFLSAAGYGVVVPELRGHGRTAGDISSPDYRLRGGRPGPDSLHAMAGDLAAVARKVKRETGLPIYLIGHSMGSIAAQLCLMRSPGLFAGAALSGLPDPSEAPGLLETIDDEIKRNGPDADCHDTFLAMFGKVNNPFHPVRTAFDWITSDQQMADYSASLPNSAVLFCNSFYRDFLLAMLETRQEKNWSAADKSMPMLLLSGGDDVISVKGKSLTSLAELLVSAGFDNIGMRIYPGLRHSILREKKRKAVFFDILRWLEGCEA